MSDTEKRPFVSQHEQRKYGSIKKDDDASSTTSTRSTTVPNASTLPMANEMRSTLSFFEKAGYGLGHVYNDLCAGVWFSYTLLYLQDALLLASGIAGALVMVGQVGDALATPIIGSMSDKYGTKRSWHVGGSILVSLSFPMIFSLCPWCSTAPPWWEPTYFAFFILAFQLGWAIVQISHLAMIPEIARTQRDRMDLTAIRYTASVFSSIVVYIVMWCVLSAGDDIQAHIVPADAPKFRDVSLILTLFGISMVVCFHFALSVTGSRRQRVRDNLANQQSSTSTTTDAENTPILERESNENAGPERSFYLSPLLYQNIFLYVFSRLFCTTALVYIPLWLNERSWIPSSSLTAFPAYTNRNTTYSYWDSMSMLPIAEGTADDKSVAHVAIIPLVSFLSSFFSSVLIKMTNHLIKPKVAYLIGSLTSIMACICVIFWAPPSAPIWVLVGIAILFGAGSSITMISSLCIAADMISKHVKQSGFIYSAVTFFDKLITGIVVVLIESLKCKTRNECPEYYRNVLAYACATAVCLGILTLASLKINRRPRPTQNELR